MTNDLVNNVNHSPAAMPPILAGQSTPETRERVERFYFSVAAIFETWVKRRQSRHTRRAYREDVMAFVRFIGIVWPRGLRVTADGLHRRRAGVPRSNGF